MADTGAPANIPLYDDNTPFTPIQTPFNGMAQAINTALAKITFFRYPTKAAMDAVAGTDIGQHATVYNDTTTPANNGDYVWSGSAWVPASFALPALFSVHAVGSQTIASGYTLITSWGTPDFNRGFAFSSGILTVQQAGIYDIVAEVATSASGINSALVTKNSASASSNVVLRVQQSGLTAFGTTPLSLAAGDQLRLFGAGPVASQTLSVDSFLALKFISAR